MNLDERDQELNEDVERDEDKELDEDVERDEDI